MKTKKLYLVREFDGDCTGVEVHESKKDAALPSDDRCSDLAFCMTGVEDMFGKAVTKRLKAGEVVEILVVIG